MFFFFKQKTAYEVRISDWSSDVCSSDLAGIRVAAVCREDAVAARAFAAEHGGTAYNDWRRVLDDAAVDAVVIATPHHLHREMAVAAAEAGKHVLLEKPMAPTVADCDAIIAAAKRSEEHTSELQSLMRNSYAVFCLKKKNQKLLQN